MCLCLAYDQTPFSVVVHREQPVHRLRRWISLPLQPPAVDVALP